MVAKDAYHHGSLRRALMDEALTLLAERGIAGLSLREVASRAGVSRAAPYHHFENKAALVHALAREGDALMSERMAAATAQTGADPIEHLIALGKAYVVFAAEQPACYSAMAARASSDTTSPADGGSTTPWDRLVGTVAECQAAGRLPAGDPIVLAVAAWSLAHGLTGLWCSGTLWFLSQSTEELEPVAETVLRAGIGSMQRAGDGKESPAEER